MTSYTEQELEAKLSLG